MIMLKSDYSILILCTKDINGYINQITIKLKTSENSEVFNFIQ